ncbi:MAG: N-acetyltransferase [Gammaproteobacteria bacterium]|nr:N-acetyltransferase [Gammaproteobacteria bacterium]MXY51927.1 N-acetyltransferase [Gammaproteobacteria bacterium]MYB36622.1 N-acetyltransferase [Gammaproteobacteria bacterium]
MPTNLTNISICDERPDDADAVHALLLECFPTEAEANLVRQLRQDGDTAFSFVALASDAIVGHVVFSRLVAPKGCLALAPVAVTASWRRQGIAAALIEAGIARAKEQGAAMLVVLGDPAYYRRFGFHEQMVRGMTSPYEGPNLMGLALARNSSPGDAIVHPPAFESV